MLPAPIGWGSERRGNAAGALSLHASARQSPHCHAWSQSLDLAASGAGLALRRTEIPRAFHGFNQQLGTNRRGSITGRLFVGSSSSARIGLAASARRRTVARSE